MKHSRIADAACQAPTKATICRTLKKYMRWMTANKQTKMFTSSSSQLPQPAASESNELPYNPLNRALSPEDLRALLGRFLVGPAGQTQQQVKDIRLFRRAFVHKSYCTRKNDTFVTGNSQCPPGCLPLQEESNERLEFLGDAVLALVTGAYLHERYDTENEGFLTRIRTKLVNGVAVGRFSLQLGFDRHLIISKQIEDSGGRKNNNLLEDCFEAFLGALYLDQGYEAAAAWLIGFLEDTIDFADLVRVKTNFKDALFKHFQHKYNETPDIACSGSPSGGYKAWVRVANGGTIGVGTGATKKEAEMAAVQAALDYCGIS